MYLLQLALISQTLADDCNAKPVHCCPGIKRHQELNNIKLSLSEYLQGNEVKRSVLVNQDEKIHYPPDDKKPKSEMNLKR